jgi:peroxiredoxin Q/BCP
MADKPLAVGDSAPAFSLPAHPGPTVRLSQFKGKQNVVLYFYPRDNTPGCTTEACDFRDNIASLNKGDAVVLGVSTDDLASHGKFADKFELPFALLADEDHAVAEKYGVWVEKSMYGKKSMGIQRATFLINKKGKLAAVWRKVKVDGHVAEVAAAVARLKDE